jgi:hypothetical protein
MSTSPPVPQTKHFTPFRSAAEEAATKSAEVRRNAPVPAARRTLYDREAPGEGLGSKSISEVTP